SRTNTCLTMKRLARSAAARIRPVPMARNRLRPARASILALVASNWARNSRWAPSSRFGPATRSDLQEFGLFVLQRIIDLIDELLSHGLKFLFSAGDFILTQVAFQGFEVVLRSTPDVSNGDTSIFSARLND